MSYGNLPVQDPMDDLHDVDNGLARSDFVNVDLQERGNGGSGQPNERGLGEEDISTSYLTSDRDRG